jgi:hypothetical protein
MIVNLFKGHQLGTRPQHTATLWKGMEYHDKYNHTKEVPESIFFSKTHGDGLLRYFWDHPHQFLI